MNIQKQDEEFRDQCIKIQTTTGMNDEAWKSYFGNENGLYGFITTRDERIKQEARRTAKKENARDFSAVVKAFNDALSAGFDAPSRMALRTVINGADARANYIDLPEQIYNTTPMEQS